VTKLRNNPASTFFLSLFTRLALIASLCVPFSVHASPITYTFSGVGSGSLGALPFTNLSVTIIAYADTSQIFTNDPTNFQLYNQSASISVPGFPTATLSNSTDFVTQQTTADPKSPGAVGIGGAPSFADILDVIGLTFKTYDLSTSFGPVSGAALGNTGLSFATTDGNFRWTSLPLTADFQAELEIVPEPATISLLSLAALVFMIPPKTPYRRRSPSLTRFAAAKLST